MNNRSLFYCYGGALLFALGLIEVGSVVRYVQCTYSRTLKTSIDDFTKNWDRSIQIYIENRKPHFNWNRLSKIGQPRNRFYGRSSLKNRSKVDFSDSVKIDFYDSRLPLIFASQLVQEVKSFETRDLKYERGILALLRYNERFVFVEAKNPAYKDIKRFAGRGIWGRR